MRVRQDAEACSSGFWEGGGEWEMIMEEAGEGLQRATKTWKSCEWFQRNLAGSRVEGWPKTMAAIADASIY